jgi:hypothetical protein
MCESKVRTNAEQSTTISHSEDERKMERVLRVCTSFRVYA